MPKKPIIILIDNDKWLIDLYGEKLRLEGFKIYSANNGKEGLKLILEHKPDLVISDIVMPNGDGFFVLNKTKKFPEIRDIPIIALTNLSSGADKEECLKLGACRYLVKAENTPSQVAKKIREIIGRK